MFGVANLLIGIVLLGGGAVVGYFIRQNIAKKQLETAEGQAAKILSEAARKAEEAVLEAKKKSVDILEEAKKNEKEREQKLAHQESRVEKREEQLDRKSHDLEKHEETLMQKAEGIKAIKEEVEKLKADELVRLQQISGLSKEEAVERIYKVAEEESRDVLVKRLSKLKHENAEELEKRALSIMGTVIQKYARSHVSEFTTSTVQIPSDEVKGKIIGKEGRNIRALEKETGVEMIVDDTPESVIISSFDPVRREIARIALEKLIEDGRIHPARIEEAVADAKKDIDQKIREAGEAAAYDAGVAGLHPKLLYILGRLRYRYSYKQNILQIGRAHV